jgi:hypothetical protein
MNNKFHLNLILEDKFLHYKIDPLKSDADKSQTKLIGDSLS